MVDRFKGIISAFAFAKMRGLEFRIHYTYPFMLQDYLQPNKYDWVLKAGELTDSLFRRRVFYGIGEYSARRLLAVNGSKEIHYYSNRDLLNNLGIKEGWGTLFHELFCLSPVLERDLNLLLAKIGQPYIAVVFRFQALLGDFKEYNFPTLKTQKERNGLIDTCINSLLSLTKSYGSSIKVLVTSDSMTFLERISSISVFLLYQGNVYILIMRRVKTLKYMKNLFLIFS